MIHPDSCSCWLVEGGDDPLCVVHHKKELYRARLIDIAEAVLAELKGEAE